MKRWIVLVLLLFLSFGCSGIRKVGIWASEEDYNNWACVVEVGQAFLLSWPAKSGYIRCALGPDIDRLPSEAVKAMEAMDKLAAKDGRLTDSDYT